MSLSACPSLFRTKNMVLNIQNNKIVYADLLRYVMWKSHELEKFYLDMSVNKITNTDELYEYFEEIMTF